MSTSWQPEGEYTDIRYEVSTGDDAGIAKITINRPEVRNAFRPETVVELIDAFERAREDQSVGVIILTGEGPDAFCSGGDQRVRGDTGYLSEEGGISMTLTRETLERHLLAAAANERLNTAMAIAPRNSHCGCEPAWARHAATATQPAPMKPKMQRSTAQQSQNGSETAAVQPLIASAISATTLHTAESCS